MMIYAKPSCHFRCTVIEELHTQVYHYLLLIGAKAAARQTLPIHVLIALTLRYGPSTCITKGANGPMRRGRWNGPQRVATRVHFMYVSLKSITWAKCLL